MKLDSLSIEDIAVNDGIIYIVDSSQGLIKVRVTNKDRVYNAKLFSLHRNASRVTVKFEREDNQYLVTAFVAGPSDIWEIDWTGNDAVIRRQYGIGPFDNYVI